MPAVTLHVALHVPCSVHSCKHNSTISCAYVLPQVRVKFARRTSGIPGVPGRPEPRLDGLPYYNDDSAMVKEVRNMGVCLHGRVWVSHMPCASKLLLRMPACQHVLCPCAVPGVVCCCAPPSGLRVKVPKLAVICLRLCIACLAAAL
jgi:hypothetical protein